MGNWWHKHPYSLRSEGDNWKDKPWNRNRAYPKISPKTYKAQKIISQFIQRWKLNKFFRKNCLSKMTKNFENLRTCCVFFIFCSTKTVWCFIDFPLKVLDFNCVNLFSLDLNKRMGKIRKGYVCTQYSYCCVFWPVNLCYTCRLLVQIIFLTLK